MAKIITILFLFILAFVGTLAGVAAATGNLNQEGLDKLLGKVEPPVQIDPVSENDELAEKAMGLKKREEEIALRESQVKAQEDRLKELVLQNEQLRDEVSALIAQLTTSLDASDADELKRLEDVSASLEKMKPKAAAQTLETWAPSDAARVLILMGERQRGAILDNMEPQVASAFLKAVQAGGA